MSAVADARGDTGAQAGALYEALRDVLAREGLRVDTLATETLFLHPQRHDLAAARGARARVLGGASGAGGPATTAVGQPPLAEGARMELAAYAFAPHAGIAAPTRDVARPSPCACPSCAPGFRARVVRRGDETSVFAGRKPRAAAAV